VTYLVIKLSFKKKKYNIYVQVGVMNVTQADDGKYHTGRVIVVGIRTGIDSSFKDSSSFIRQILFVGQLACAIESA